MKPPGAGPDGRRRRLLLRDAACGLYAQMYFWGRDVRHPSGNLLLARGMTRIAKTTLKGTSRYRQAWRGGWVELHGHHASWHRPRHEGGIRFDRGSGAWRIWSGPVEDSDICSLGEKTSLEELEAAATILIAWLADYETWAQTRWTMAERRAQHRDFLKLRPRRWWLPPGESLAWFRQFAENPFHAVRPRELRSGA